MAHWRSVVFHPPEAQKLADLAGIETDLLAVEDYCLRFLTEHEKEGADGSLLEIICAAALVRYGRVFASGVRSGIPLELVEGLNPAAQEWHRYLKGARDKWIAHSVNTFEENQVCAWLTPPERGPIGVYGISVRQHRVATLSRDAITALAELASVLRKSIKQVQEEETRNVLALAQALPPEPFYEQVDEPLLPGSRHPEKVRRTK